MRTGFRKTTTEFIDEAISIHGDKYDYSKVYYINTHAKVCIICPEHGEFWQTPHSHLKGTSCTICGRNKGHNNNTTTTSDYIKKAHGVHGDKYDYSNTIYVNPKTKIEVICPLHGVFFQAPYNHLNGNGCPACNIKTVDDFLLECDDIHCFKYDYSKVRYVDSYTKVCIICPEHGEFWQTPKNHRTGRGCQKCRSSKGERLIRKQLHNYGISFKEQYRFKDCRNKLPLPFDFYIPELNVCIEYDGKQHYTPIDFFGGTKGYERIKIHDHIKTDFCDTNGLLLIRIRYDDDITEKLNLIIL